MKPFALKSTLRVVAEPANCVAMIPMSTRILEIERKFIPMSNMGSLLRANKGTPKFKQLEYLGHSAFEDTYYDRDNILFRNNIWIRSRSGDWQAKVRCEGDIDHSQFAELKDICSIKALLKEHLDQVDSETNAFGLQSFARFQTRREEWKADDNYIISLDKTDFGYEVGEVETQSVASDSSKTVEEESQLAQQMDQDIISFMEKYHWVFPSGKPMSKLAAYMLRS